MTKKVEMGRAPRILLVEDNRGDVLLLRRAITQSQANLELTVAPTAEEAIVLLRGAADGRSGALPDLIVTDLNLPGMHGVDFLRTLKADPSLKRIPCVVLTSSSDNTEVESAYDAYANGFLTKPSSSDGYLQMVAELTAYWFALVHTPPASDSDRLPADRIRSAITDLQGYSVRTPHAPVPQVSSFPQKAPMSPPPVSPRILVVEDESDIRDLLQIVLTSNGYEVATAENGREGLDRLGSFAPNLVLLDLAMPELDGIGFLVGKNQLSVTHPDWRQVPVIVLSALDKNADVMLAIEMGADSYITKPFDTEVVLNSIARLLVARRDTIDQ